MPSRPEIAVMVPELPTADELLPYLRAIDHNRQYSNGGPLVRELERLTRGVAVSSGTVGLQIAAKYVFRAGEVRIPAFTFPATALALIHAGLTPVLCDVDEDSWTMPVDEQSLPVCPFGVAVDGPLVDAAGAWGNGVTGNRVYSLHATKILPAGEGGLICGDEGLLQYARKVRNFGFDGDVIDSMGTNAKLSEYHAAVALASLNTLERRVARLQAIERRYRRNLTGAVRFQERPIGNYTIFPVLIPDAEGVGRRMKAQGIETRRWYLPSLERHPAFADLPRESLPVTRRLNQALLCLPFHTSLTDADVDFVCEALVGRSWRAA